VSESASCTNSANGTGGSEQQHLHHTRRQESTRTREREREKSEAVPRRKREIECNDRKQSGSGERCTQKKTANAKRTECEIEREIEEVGREGTQGGHTQEERRSRSTYVFVAPVGGNDHRRGLIVGGHASWFHGQRNSCSYRPQNNSHTLATANWSRGRRSEARRRRSSATGLLGCAVNTHRVTAQVERLVGAETPASTPYPSVDARLEGLLTGREAEVARKIA
jgi:hypothetical protein